MVTDNSRNWRFRYELAECVLLGYTKGCLKLSFVISLLWHLSVCVFRQLILIIELYSHNDIYDYLRQIALNLCSDKVSEVRWISYKLVSQVSFSLFPKIVQHYNALY